MSKILSLGFLISLISCTFLQGQEQFDRLYPTNNRKMEVIDISVNAADNYFILSSFEEFGNNPARGVNLSRFSPKGDLDWSVDYVIEDSIAVSTAKGEVDATNPEALYISYYLEDEDNTDNSILMKTSSIGEPEWTKRFYPSRIDSSLNSRCEVSTIDDQVFFASSQVDSFANQSIINKLDEEGNAVWARQLSYRSSSDDELYSTSHDDLSLAIDSTIHILSSVDSMEVFKTALTNIDTLGNINFAYSYFIEESGENLLPTEMVSFPDSTKIILGVQDNRGVIIKLDSLYNITWAKRARIADFNTLDNIVLASDGNAVIQGSSFSAVAQENEKFIFKIDAAGEVIWQSYFPEFAGFFSFGGDLVNLESGVAYANTEFQGPIATSRLLKLDQSGATSCEDTLVNRLLFDIDILKDTIVWEITDRDSMRDLSLQARSFSGFDIPVLSLQDTMFCPGDPVEFLLDATTDGAVSYTWMEVEEGQSTVVGTDSTFLATKIDIQYIATVRIELDNCFTLCDTTMLTEISPPTVSIGVDNSQYCNDPDNRIFTIFANASGAQSIVWSTGATGVSSIDVTDFADYSVTVTNQCDDTDTATINISEANIPSGDLIPVGAVFGQGCDALNVTLVIQDNGETYTDILWNTGATTETIVVSTAGTYEVRGTDSCGRVVTGAATLSANDFLQPAVLSIISDQSQICEDNTIRLSVSNPERWTNIMWSTGPNDPSIVVTDDNTYEVQATDECGLISNADIFVDNFYEALTSLTINENIVCIPGPDGGEILESFELATVTEGSGLSYLWSDGSTQPSLTGTEPGSYSVTVTDECGVSLEAQALVQCGSCNIESTRGDNEKACLCFANIFFPQTVRMTIEVDDRTFSPVNYCGEVDDYQMAIYSRWGNKVFETSDVAEAWDGMKGSDRAPAEVYVVYAKYSIAGEEFEYKGNLTLIR